RERDRGGERERGRDRGERERDRGGRDRAGREREARERDRVRERGGGRERERERERDLTRVPLLQTPLPAIPVLDYSEESAAPTAERLCEFALLCCVTAFPPRSARPQLCSPLSGMPRSSGEG
ncbi:hypothetical protein AAFF_G00190670, partial [Aldrovandia affinis]